MTREVGQPKTDVGLMEELSCLVCSCSLGMKEEGEQSENPGSNEVGESMMQFAFEAIY